MKIKYGFSINKQSIEVNFKRLINQIYKLLPEREENLNWKSHLDSIIIEVIGLNELLPSKNDAFLFLLCKLEGLFYLSSIDEFHNFRKTIFECLSLCTKLKKELLIECQD